MDNYRGNPALQELKSQLLKEDWDRLAWPLDQKVPPTGVQAQQGRPPAKPAVPGPPGQQRWSAKSLPPPVPF